MSWDIVLAVMCGAAMGFVGGGIYAEHVYRNYLISKSEAVHRTPACLGPGIFCYIVPEKEFNEMYRIVARHENS